MKTITTTKICLPMAGMILTAALALPAEAQTQVPFKGAFQGSDTVIPPMVTQTITGTGTLIGRFSSITHVTLTAFGGTGTGEWIAANRDTIDTTVVASDEHVDMALARFWARSAETLTLRSPKFTRLLAARVDSPESKAALP